MKKRILSFLLAIGMAMTLLSSIALAAPNTGYTFTGNGADDIVSIALAQKGIGGSKGGSDFGFPSTDSWCAYFVCWAGRTAQLDFPSSNLGTPLGVAKWFIDNNKGVFYCFRDGNYNSLINEGAKNTDNIVRTTRKSFAPKKGDLICYLWANSEKKGYNWSHIGIVTADYTGNGLVSTVEGNAGATNLYNGKVGTYNQSYDSRIVGIIRPNYSGSYNNMVPYFTCNVRIACFNGQRVNLYNYPGDASSITYFDKGQVASSTRGLVRDDGTVWYQITANHNGADRTFWLKYEAAKMTVTNLMPEGPYTLTPACAPGARLDVKDSSAKDGANVQIYTGNGTDAQQWYVRYLNNGCYSLTSKASGKALDVAGASKEAGANVQQYTANGTDAQQWMLKDAGDGYYYLCPKVNSSLCMDVAGAGSADGTNVGLFTANGTDAQRWKLETPSVSFTVTFNPNGGSVPQRSKTVTAGSAYGTLPMPTRSGYTFNGWYTSSKSGSLVTSNVTVRLTSDQTLYAHWTKEEHTHTSGGYIYLEEHPHNKLHTCSACGKTYTDNSTGYMSSCSICNPPKEPARTEHTHTPGAYVYSEEHPHYKFYTCTTCGEIYTDNSTTYMSGCSVCNPPKERWGSWSGWSSTPVSSSSTREVETRRVKISDGHTEYRYGRYVDGTGRNAGWCTAYLTKLGFSGMTAQYSDWTASQYPVKEKDWTCGVCSGPHTGVHHYSADGRAWWKEYVSPRSGNFFWEETRQTDAVYETQYRYRDKILG